MRVAPALGKIAGQPVRRTLLLVNPFYPKDPFASFGKHVLTPTLALTSLANAVPDGWRVQYWDENLLQGPPPHDPLPQVVAITVHLTFARRAYELADWYRRGGSKVILGGLHVNSCPDEASSHADSIITGDGVTVLRDALADLERSQLRCRYAGSFTTPYSRAPAPRRELLDRRSFLTTTSLNATRGCHSRCGFCYLSTDGLHMPYHTLDPREVARQWSQDRQPYAVFTDNNLGSKPDYLLKLCQELEKVGGIWSAAVSLDVTDRPEVVRAMALSGCTGVFVGFESLTDDNLRDARKRTPTADEFGRRVELFHRHGIQVNGSFVLGFDHDDETCFQRTVDWIEKYRLECATFHILTPYPATPLFRQMEAEGRLLHREWERYDTAHVVFKPKRMSIEQLQSGYEWCYRRLFSHQSIWRRKPEGLAAASAYLAMSYLYKRSNWLWPFLIRHRLTQPIWRPLIELSRLRHLSFRERLRMQPLTSERSVSFVSASV